MPEEAPDRLARKLLDRGYDSLFGMGKDQGLVDSLLSAEDTKALLISIVRAEESSWEERFLASEFLFRYVDMTSFQGCDRALLHESYYQAMKGNATGNGADWGFEEGPSAPGPLGSAAIGWGKEGSCAFEKGLDDGAIVRMNFNWGLPPHFRPPYRVKDFSALILARIHGFAVDLSGEPEERDDAIEELKIRLG